MSTATVLLLVAASGMPCGSVMSVHEKVAQSNRSKGGSDSRKPQALRYLVDYKKRLPKHVTRNTKMARQG